jgi:hypothetical protein
MFWTTGLILGSNGCATARRAASDGARRTARPGLDDQDRLGTAWRRAGQAHDGSGLDREGMEPPLVRGEHQLDRVRWGDHLAVPVAPPNHDAGLRSDP